MAYISNIPQPTDLFSQSQPQILGNFGALQTLIDVNHVDFADATNMGKHNFVSFYPQSVVPTLNNTTDVIAYGKVYSVTNQNELWISKVNQVTVTNIPASASILSTTSSPSTNTAGWTYLPSGILMKWGSATITSTNIAPDQIVLFPTSANIPVFGTVFSMQLTVTTSGTTDNDKFVLLAGFGATSLVAIAALRDSSGTYTTATFQYLAIGK